MLFLQEDWCAQALASQVESLQVRRKSRPAGPRDARTLAPAGFPYRSLSACHAQVGLT